MRYFGYKDNIKDSRVVSIWMTDDDKQEEKLIWHINGQRDNETYERYKTTWRKYNEDDLALVIEIEMTEEEVFEELL